MFLHTDTFLKHVGSFGFRIRNVEKSSVKSGIKTFYVVHLYTRTRRIYGVKLHQRVRVHVRVAYTFKEINKQIHIFY